MTDKIQEDIKYLFSKINWNESFLDAKAITIMNNLNKDIAKIKQETLSHLKEEISKWERIDSSMPDYALGWNMAIKEVLTLIKNMEDGK